CGLPKAENFRALQGPLIENQACVISPATASQRTVADSFFLRSSRRLHRDAGGEAADERSAFSLVHTRVNRFSGILSKSARLVHRRR
ncbi:hypothetical protein, partial [Pyramidobacter piscolens]